MTLKCGSLLINLTWYRHELVIVFHGDRILTKLSLSQDAAVASVQKYGVGSCGPRGFYGTIGRW